MGNASVHLKANNGQYVSAQDGGGGLIVANSNAPLVWESFVLVNIQGTPLQDGSLVALQCNNGQFVCAENSGGSTVVANRASIGFSETFTIKRVGGGGSIQSGDRVAFLCNNGIHYLCAEGGGGRELVANRSAIGPWETFVITLLPPRHVRIEIESIYCDNTEDVTGADELYFIGSGVSRSDNQITAVVTKPIDINDGQTKTIPPDQRIVFDGTVECADTIVIGLKAYDEDAAKDWDGKRGQLLSKISAEVAAALAKTGPKGVVAGVVLKGAVEAFKLLVSFDKDDELGSWEATIPVVTLPLPSSRLTWNFRRGRSGWSTWNYTVTFLISVTPHTGPVTYQTPTWAVMGNELIKSVGVSSWHPDVMDLFVRGTDNQLYYKWYDSNNGGWMQGYQQLRPGEISFSPVAVSGGGSDLIDVFARGISASDGVYHKVLQGRVWSSWQRLGSMDTLSGPGLSWEPGRHLGVFVRGTDNALYLHQYSPNDGWVGPWALDGQISSSPAAIALVNGPVHVFARGTDNALWHRWYNNGWQNWVSLGGPLGGQISSDPESGPSVCSWGPGRLDVFVRGTDNAVWHKWSDDSGVSWSNWESLGGVVTSSPASISRASNYIDVFARGTDSKLYRIWWDGTAWRP